MRQQRWAVILGSVTILILMLASCVAPPATSSGDTTAWTAQQNRVAEIVRMAETLDLLSQKAWERDRLSAARYQSLHAQYESIKKGWDYYGRIAMIDLLSRNPRPDTTARDSAAGEVQTSFWQMVRQAQEWGVIKDVTELKP
jgi:PBP1b-binding outer membrane lipoprotein LpoB